MRDLLRLPALLLFFFVLLLLLLTGIDLMSVWGAGLSAGREEALRLAGVRVLPALRDALPAAVLLSLVLILFRITLKPGSRFLQLVGPLVVAFVLLAFGYRGLAGLEDRLGVERASRAEGVERAGPGEDAGRYLVPERFNEVGGKVLYPSELDQGSLGAVVLYDPQARPPRLQHASRGHVQVLDGGLRVHLDSATRELAARGAYEPLFDQDPRVRPLLEDVRLLNGILETLYRESRSGFPLLCFALVFAFYAAGLFFRVSRWPLLNVVIAGFVFRGYLYLTRLLGHDLVIELGKVFGNPGVLRHLPALVLLVLGVLFLLIEALFVPRERWRLEGA